jgi:molybdenum cofactor guanylyltransferase
MTPPLPFAGAVLCGGASSRMGRDKALLEVRGTPMARRVADALAAAGATSVVAVGGDAPALRALGLAVVPDEAPGAGPLAAVATALRYAGRSGDDVVLVVACDLLRPSPAAMAAVIGTLAGHPRADLAVPVAEGRRQWGHGAWRTRALPRLDAQLATGERAIHRAVAAAGLVVAEATGVPEDDLADADTPNDLARVRDEGDRGHAH